MLAQKLILSYSTRIAIQVIQMIGMLLVARILGPNVLGTVAFGLAFVSLFSFLTDFGLGSTHIKFISEGRDVAKCNGTFAILKIILTVLYITVVLAFYFVQKLVFGVEFESPDHDYVIMIYLIITSIGKLYSIPTSTFAAKTEQAKQDFPNFVQILLYQILRVIVAFLGYKAVAQSLSNLAAVVLVLPIYLYLFKDNPVGKFDKTLAKLYFNISIPFFIAIIAQTVIHYTDKVLLQYLTNSIEVGYYSAGFSISQFVSLIEASAGLLFFPFFTKNLSEGEYEKVNSSVQKFERFNLSFVLPFVLYIAVFSEFVVSVALGHKFAKTPPILSVVTLAMFVSLISLPYINIITGKGLLKLSASIMVTSAVLFIILSFIFVSPMFLDLKGIGIAISLLMTNIFTGIVFMSYTKKKLNMINILKGKYLLMYGLVYSVIAYFIMSLFSGDIFTKIIASIVFFVGYFGLAFVFKIIKIEDWKMTLEIINVKKMVDYVNTELINKNKEI